MGHSDLSKHRGNAWLDSPRASGKCATHGDYIGVIVPCGPHQGQVSGCPTCARDRDDARDREQREMARRAHTEVLIDRANVAPLFREATFEGAPDIVRNFGGSIATSCQYGRNLVLSGPVGTGKSHCASALVIAAVRAGLTARIMTLREFVLSLRATWGRRSGPTEQDVLEEAIALDLFVFDDIGANQCKDDEMVYVFDLIDGRNKRCKSSIITTNLDKLNLRNVLGERTFDRLRHRGDWVTFGGPSRRGSAT